MTAPGALIRSLPANPTLSELSPPDTPRWSLLSLASALLMLAAQVFFFVADKAPLSDVTFSLLVAFLLLCAAPAIRVAIRRFRSREARRLRWAGPVLLALITAMWAVAGFGAGAVAAAAFALWEEALFWLVLPALLMSLLTRAGLADRAAWVLSLLGAVLLFVLQPYHLSQYSTPLAVLATGFQAVLVSAGSLFAGRWWLSAATHLAWNAHVEPFEGPSWMWMGCLTVCVLLSVAAVFRFLSETSTFSSKSAATVSSV